MKEIFEIRLHGRGGQGAKTAAQLIAETALEKGKQIQAFPEYGPERTGAPMKAYTRISDKRITTYAPVVNPDAVLVIDPTLIEAVDVAEGLGKDGILIVNTDKEPEEIRKEVNFKGKIFTVDATKISIELLGKNLPNMPIIGALIKTTGILTLEDISIEVRNHFTEKIGEKNTEANIKAIKKAYDEVK